MISFIEFKKVAHGTKAARMERDRLYAIIREVSVRCSYLLLRLCPWIRPNQVSLALIMFLVLSLAGNLFFRVGGAAFQFIVIQLVLLQVAALGDRIDGEIARYQRHFTQRGLYYDRIFHFIFPFALYLAVGFFFSRLVEKNGLVLLAFGLGMFASLASLLGKLRAHLKYKITLEHHELMLQDLYPQQRVLPVWPGGVVGRVARYLVFMTYDWVWFFYSCLIVLAWFWPLQAALVFVLHGACSLIALGWYILVTFPRYGLLATGDLD